MRVVVASDSFKGSLTSLEVGRIVTAELARLEPSATCDVFPMADGGEGTVEAVAQASGAMLRHYTVRGPLGSLVAAPVALAQDGKVAVIDMASASGLTLVPPQKRNPLRTSTYGTGQLILHALDAGAREILVGVGGSATNDGGMGCLVALGARFLDANGCELAGTGADLARVSKVDLLGLDARLSSCKVRLLSDVNNPLLGPDGATRTFGPQKGANEALVDELERGMANYAQRMAEALGQDFSACPGAGAAGGLGFALQAVLGATFALGAEQIIDLVGLDRALAGADLCITGEGHADAQTSHGKVVSCVAKHCVAAGVPCVALVGGSTTNTTSLEEAGVDAVVPCVPEVMDLSRAMRDASTNVAWTSQQMLRLFLAARGGV